MHVDVIEKLIGRYWIGQIARLAFVASVHESFNHDAQAEHDRGQDHND